MAQVVQPTGGPARVELIPVDRRPTDAEIAALDASLPRQPQHVAAVLTGLREPPRPVGTGPAGAEAADAFEAVRIIARACGVDVHAAGRAVPAVASGPVRRGARRATPRWVMRASCIPR